MILRSLISTFVILLICVPVASAQRLTSLTAASKGHGTLIIGDTKQEIHSIVVVLREGGEAQITLVTDLQLSTQGRWTVGDDATKGIDLTITGGIVSGNATGTGRLLLRSDGKTIDKLMIKSNSATGGQLTIDFTAEP